MAHVKDDTNPRLTEYISKVGNEEIKGFDEITDLTRKHFGKDDALMVSGPDVLQLLRWLVKVRNVRKAIEVGVFTGASALAMAQAMPAYGQLIAIDVSKEYTDIGKPVWQKYGVSDRIQLSLDGGVKALTRLANDKSQQGTFDLIYLDAVKEEYVDYGRLAAKLLKPGGLLVADNILWNLEVPLEPKKFDSTMVKGLRKFNLWLKHSPDFESVAINLSDGVALASKL